MPFYTSSTVVRQIRYMLIVKLKKRHRVTSFNTPSEVLCSGTMRLR
ncbi:hypothetical protein APHCRT_0960 [Anaplasma phagocytophilum str. CRT53-1]|uniref:Uncharacterized protein n=3 Tax=Anaplasma phagocytophilum TaxID=948 RepID=A0A0F3N891_ANAPH|nr:hypothetical protein APHWEB_1174 [Anaplasma phagocytophilum str. Webster]KJV63129.1 hypothetical protein EPHNCH_1162 [Anaplasma phagocytophilum str. NCH-1]KJV84909.1 hypothetical protein APHWI1_0343 [Anaplasma phagocytophilum str. ApWI1]KJV85768.1 hypothetical protein APHCRT_0960 [Anaplasma phagocytophilum str. CRT53-1]KJV87235.1 hypothetical protein APHNYW_0853 [Anaplasma phagocytophilum str. ApNYW]